MSGGLVAILAHETGRYSEFWECVVGLDLPDRTIVKALYGADIAFGYGPPCSLGDTPAH